MMVLPSRATVSCGGRSSENSTRSEPSQSPSDCAVAGLVGTLTAARRMTSTTTQRSDLIVASLTGNDAPTCYRHQRLIAATDSTGTRRDGFPLRDTQGAITTHRG